MLTVVAALLPYLCVGQLKDAAAEIAKVMQSRQEAEQQISASKVKMDVLSNYFKDKEKELMRCVGVHSLCHVRVSETLLVTTTNSD